MIDIALIFTDCYRGGDCPLPTRRPTDGRKENPMPMMGIHGRPLTDAGELRSRRVPIACGVWFTSTGRLIPLSVKWKDDEGFLRMLTGIRVITVEDKNYCGVPSTEYECEAEYCGARVHFHLLYYATRREWKLLWNVPANGKPD